MKILQTTIHGKTLHCKIKYCHIYFYLKSIASEDIVTKLVLFILAIRGDSFSEPIVNIVQLYKLPLRFAKINIFDGKLKLE